MPNLAALGVHNSFNAILKDLNSTMKNLDVVDILWVNSSGFLPNVFKVGHFWPPNKQVNEAHTVGHSLIFLDLYVGRYIFTKNQQLTEQIQFTNQLKHFRDLHFGFWSTLYENGWSCAGRACDLSIFKILATWQPRGSECKRLLNMLLKCS